MHSLADIKRIFAPRRRSQRRMPVKRLMKYYRHRVGRLPGTAHQIAAGFASGMAVSMTPFIGLHIVLGIVVCLVLRVAPVAMVIGSVVGGNPWTFPFIWVGSYEIGQMLLARRKDAGSIENLHLSDLFNNPVDLLWPMTLGSLPLAIIVGAISYAVVLPIVRRHHANRIARRSKKGGA